MCAKFVTEGWNGIIHVSTIEDGALKSEKLQVKKLSLLVVYGLLLGKMLGSIADFAA